MNDASGMQHICSFAAQVCSDTSSWFNLILGFWFGWLVCSLLSMWAEWTLNQTKK